MTLAGYWPPSSKVEIGDFGDGTNYCLWSYFGFYFFSVRGTKTFFFRFRAGKFSSAAPNLGELAEIIDDVNVETIPIRYHWSCRTFQTASHIHVIHIGGVWAPSQVVEGHMASHSHHYHHRHLPRFVRVGWNPTWCKFANHATMLRMSLYNLSNCIPYPWHTYMRCLSTFSGCGWAFGFTFTSIPPQTLPQICESYLKSYLMQMCKPC